MEHSLIKDTRGVEKKKKYHPSICHHHHQKVNPEQSKDHLCWKEMNKIFNGTLLIE
jgi:hypothetical protein